MNTGFKVGILVMGVLMLACCGGVMLTLSPVTAVVDKREKEARDYGDAYTKQILKNWDAKQLVSLSTAKYREEFSEEQFAKTLAGNKKALGTFLSGRGRASLVNAEKTKDSSTILAKYESRASFERGKAKVRLNLRLENKKWSIELFSIEPI